MAILEYGVDFHNSSSRILRLYACNFHFDLLNMDYKANEIHAFLCITTCFNPKKYAICLNRWIELKR